MRWPRRTGDVPKGTQGVILLKMKALRALDMPYTVQYTAHMGGPSQLTVPVTFRILRSQDAALKQMTANGVSTSAFMRKLLSLYLDGKIPEASPSPVVANGGQSQTAQVA